MSKPQERQTPLNICLLIKVQCKFVGDRTPTKQEIVEHIVPAHKCSIELEEGGQVEVKLVNAEINHSGMKMWVKI